MTALVAMLDQVPAARVATACAHCGGPMADGGADQRFCCTGCAAAFATIQGMGLGDYYAKLTRDPAARRLRPEDGPRPDLTRAIRTDDDGKHTLVLAVDGLQCGACVWLIESMLSAVPGLARGRVNMTTRRLTLVWEGAAERAGEIVGRVEALGYRLVPFHPAALRAARDSAERQLLRALGVAAFGAGNVMLMSLGIWFGLAETMGPATRGLMHWVSALIAMPCIAYAGIPFFKSAWAALRHGRTNMDVPISVGVILVTVMSLAETIQGGAHAYFDSAAALLFFLLVGRVLDARARGVARETAEQLLALRDNQVSVRAADGTLRRQAADSVALGTEVLVGMGERIGVDGVVIQGDGQVDTSLVSGESLPRAASSGTQVFAGTMNLGAPLVVRTSATGDSTLLAECGRLIAAAEARRGRFVVLADRVARAYAPVVHVLALVTFISWYGFADAELNESLLTAAAVLIITCPCALALAVPAVQVIATGQLFRAGVLLKSATALERLAQVDTVVFDKTGTLTDPVPHLEGATDPAARHLAAELAANSRHPLCRALVAAVGEVVARQGVVEHAGQGLSLATDDGEVRLGSRAFCGVGTAAGDGPELWLARPGHDHVRFGFAEAARPATPEVLAALRGMGLRLHLLSGDRAAVVGRLAGTLGIDAWRGAATPAAKVAALEALAAEGRHVLMVGDGLNDAPSLAAAHVSATPAHAADISQSTADVVFPDKDLSPVVVLLRMARRARAVTRENIGFAIGYNALFVPLAMAGYVTPWLAAAAMSSSSLVVMANSLRVRKAGGGWT